MTKLEKLAKEYADPHFLNEHEGYDVDPAQAFIIGFLSAATQAHEILLAGGGEYEIREWIASLTEPERKE